MTEVNEATAMVIEPTQNQLNRLRVVNSLRWHKFPVLDDGFVTLVDVMGDDESIVQAARVSYGDGTKKTSDSETLIRYLLRHRHTTPFEMAEVKLLVRVPMDCWRQWIRHRTANVNEYSTRYSLAIDSAQHTQPEEWRLQSTNNKQGSSGLLHTIPQDTTKTVPVMDGPNVKYEYPPSGAEIAANLTLKEDKFLRLAREVYEERLQAGISREQARKDLPLSTYTEAYWKVDLHNLLHFLSLRMDAHAQYEIRAYSNIIGHKIIKPLFPIVWSAFEDYRINARSLSGREIEVIQKLAKSQKPVPYTMADVMECQHYTWIGLKRCRERDECINTLRTLNLMLQEENDDSVARFRETGEE